MCFSVAIKIPKQKQSWAGRTGSILRVQPQIADDIIRPPVAVEICRGNRTPPAGSCGLETRSSGPIIKTTSEVVVKIFYIAPIKREQQIDPPVSVDVAPQRRSYHPYVLQTRCRRLGNVGKNPITVGE